MLDIHRVDGVPRPKIYFSHSTLPSYIDPQNVSTKKKPFTAINKQKYSHTMDLILPEELFVLVKDKIENVESFAHTQYARVYMSLSEILENEFFNSYIKQGNIMMLSEGRPNVDNRFELFDGILRMELNRPTYERCGLQGMPIEDGGKKHQKQRWTVEHNLRASSMKQGGKAFSRLQKACKDVLNHSLAWLFYNFNPSSSEALRDGREPISKHAPKIMKVAPEIRMMKSQSVPTLSPGDFTQLYSDENAVHLLEYLHMISLDSPRLQSNDNIDPYLSRYEIPDLGNVLVPRNMIRLRWIGFIPPAFACDVFLSVRSLIFKSKTKVSGSKDVTMDEESMWEDQEREARWFGLSAPAFGGNASWTIMQFGRKDTLLWETES